MARPLEGIFVLDFSTLLPGPLATLLLAEAGAEVVKVERPARGDDAFDRERSDRGPAALTVSVPSYFPVVWKNIVLYCDDAEIFARELAGDHDAAQQPPPISA